MFTVVKQCSAMLFSYTELNNLILKGQYHDRSSKFCANYAKIIKVHSSISEITLRAQKETQ